MPNPETAPGNKALLAGSTLYESNNPSERMAAPPLLFFQAWSKGRVEFVGLGLTETVERVAQRMPGGEFFSNYRYECALLSLSEEGERLAWNWIADRGRAEVDNEGSLKHAPASWKNWVYGASLDSQRRKMAVSPSLSSKEQLPPPGSKQDRLLKQVIGFYKGRQHRFEAVAEVIASRVLGKRYEMGWVTRGTGDRGIDFVGRLTIGDGAASTKVVVLGQAKCEAPGKPTNGMDVSRTVARLQRGWIGCYVTTSFFSRQSQEELAVDKYPLITVSGDRVVKELEQIAAESGVTVMELVRSIDDGYKERLKHRRPEEVLYI